MRYCFCAFLCCLRSRLRNTKTWLILLLLPALAIAASGMMTVETTAPVTVGVVLPAEGGERIWELLSAQSGDLLTFLSTDAETLDRNVASGKWDCGLILPDDFSHRIQALDTDRLVTLRISAGSSVYPLVQESVSSCLAQLVTPGIAWEYLLQTQMIDSGEYASMLTLLEENQAACKKIGIRLRTADGMPLEVPQLMQQGTQRVLYWLIAAVILVRMLFGSADLNKFAGSPAARRLQPLRSSVLLLTARAGADGFLISLSGTLAMVILNGGIWGCLAVWSYTLFWMSVSVLLAQLRGIHQILVVFVPAALVVSFLLSSVIVDISLFLPGLSGLLRWIPAVLFLDVCSAQAGSLLLLIAAALICWFAAPALSRAAGHNP